MGLLFFMIFNHVRQQKIMLFHMRIIQMGRGKNWLLIFNHGSQDYNCVNIIGFMKGVLSQTKGGRETELKNLIFACTKPYENSWWGL